MSREYYYKHREHYIQYGRTYYETNKSALNEKRKLREAGHPRRKRANLITVNKAPELEERRKTYEAIRTAPKIPLSEPVTLPIPLYVPRPEDFIVKFD